MVKYLRFNYYSGNYAVQEKKNCKTRDRVADGESMDLVDFKDYTHIIMIVSVFIGSTARGRLAAFQRNGVRCNVVVGSLPRGCYLSSPAKQIRKH